MTTRAEDEIRTRVVDDFFFFAQFLKVLDFETGHLVPLVLKPVQERLARHIIERLVAGDPVRVIVLKARREGVSTVVQAIFYWLASTRRYQVAVTLSHHDDTTKTLHEISDRYYRNVPGLLRPMKRQSRRGQVLEFANPSTDADVAVKNPGLESIMRTVTAKNAGAGQGANLLHCSEVGLWDENAIDAGKVLDTLMQIIPRTPGTIIIMESTARGVGNEFHARWERAVENLQAGETTGFYPFFVPWFDEPTYRLQAGSYAELGDLDEEEEQLRDWGVTDDQLAWRRWKLREEVSSLDAFHQEFPATADEAFLASGRPYFDQQAVREHRDWARTQPVLAVGEIVEDGQMARFRPNRRGALTVWEAPREGEDYLIACDSSEGSESGDPQHAYVFARSKLQVVAAWHGRVERDELGDIIYLLGRVYSTALVAPEMNGGWGHTLVAILRRRGYWRIYRSPGENKVKRRRVQQWGWVTTPSNRPLVLDALGEAIRDGELDCPDPELFTECLTFVYGDGGKPQAMPGKHDDRVVCAAIGVYLWQTEPIHHQDRPKLRPRRVLSQAAGY